MVELRHLTALSARRGLLLAIIVCVSATCGSKGPTQPDPPQQQQQQQQQNPTLTSVTVTSGRNAIDVGQTEQFTATANFSNNTTQNVTSTASWSSGNTGVATVSASGVASGVSAGSADIRATFQGITGSRSLQVNAPAQVAPVARFTVSGPRGADSCDLRPGGDLDCQFNGSASSGGTGGNVVRWTWRFDVGRNGSPPRNSTTPIFNPTTDCGFFVDKPDAQPGTSFVQMIVKLEVFNAAGTGSAEARNANVRLFPNKQCDFGF